MAFLKLYHPHPSSSIETVVEFEVDNCNINKKRKRMMNNVAIKSSISADQIDRDSNIQGKFSKLICSRGKSLL